MAGRQMAGSQYERLTTTAVLMLLLYATLTFAQANDVQPSMQKRIDQLKQRASRGDAKAQVELGMLYATGDGLQTDDAEAVRWFRKAADQGDAAGEYSLGEMYAFGRGVPSDNSEAFKWLRRSAEHGDPRGQYNLAAMYSEGKGVAKDDGESAKWMQKAAEHDFAAAQFGLGVLYAHGRGGLPHDEVQAVLWYRKAMDQGDLPAANNLALLLATSKDSQVQNRGEAVEIAQKLVDGNPQEPAYLDTLAATYYEGGHYEKAVDTEKKAVALNPEKAAYREALQKYLTATKH